MISFVHCGDIHLGIMPEKNAVRFNDFFVAFSNCIDYAINKKVNFIIVAGDMFHQKIINSKTLSMTCEILKKAKDENIPVFVIEGNHDRAFYIDEESWLAYLHKENLIDLLCVNNNGGKLSIANSYECDNYRVVGVGYLGGATEKYIPEISNLLPSDNKINILIMHTAIDRMKSQNMGDISGEEILKLKDKCDYLALGHVHYRYEFEDFAFNPGSLENLRTRDDLSGEKGFYYVNIDEETKEKHIEYVASKKRKIIYKKLDCTSIDTPDGVIDKIKLDMDSWDNISNGCIIYFSLCGSTAFNPLLIDLREIKELTNNRFDILYSEVINNINDIDIDESNNDGINIDAIIESEIENELKKNHADLKEPDKKAKIMLELANSINSNMLEKDIFDLLSRKEDL